MPTQRCRNSFYRCHIKPRAEGAGNQAVRSLGLVENKIECEAVRIDGQYLHGVDMKLVTDRHKKL